jgi:hypothetical protein
LKANNDFEGVILTSGFLIKAEDESDVQAGKTEG